MNSDPNNIEKWLQNYAQQRRADLGKPLDMDSPTRDMLLSESRRVWPSARATQAEETSLWPQWAFAAACTGVIACTLVYLSQPAPIGLVAKNNSNPISKGEPTADGEMKPNAEREAASMQTITPFAPLLASKKTDFKKADAITMPGFGGGAGGAGAAVAAVPSAMSQKGIAGPSLLPAEAQAIESFREQFAQVKSELGKESPKASEDVVLRNFRYEQAGADVQIFDADGSVYSGRLTALPGNLSPVVEPKHTATVGKVTPVTPNSIMARRTNQAAGGAPAIAGAQLNDGNYQSRGAEYNFQVVGTNRSLKQRVVFSGQIGADQNQLDRANSSRSKANATNENSRGVTEKGQGAMQYRIRGQAVIGGRNQEVDAQPIPVPAPRKNQNQ